jgi:lipooligosaccharide transport system permease protein
MAAPALRVLEGQVRAYRHTWRGSVVSTFVTPVLYLAAMGLGLGQLVERPEALGGLTYLEFVGTGLLAASAMQIAASDGAFPVMAGMKWRKTYHAALATPVAARDLAVAHLAWIVLRLVLAAAVYGVVLWGFGVAPLGRALLAIGPAVLIGLAFAAPVVAFAARLENEYGLSSLFRFAIVPLFLFSGTFFPVSQLPDWLEPVALLTPLWHGVQLTRLAVLDAAPALPPLVHAAVLLGCFAVGAVLAVRGFERRLVS